ncbi:MAG: homoserine dehydrogenase [Acidobacteria bacterium]|nr:homoserine dehydrogenase [Acidobacteriota bacterium]
MPAINVGVIGLGQVGGGTLAILHENAQQIREKLGFDLCLNAICSRSVLERPPAAAAWFPGVFRTTNWQDVVAHPDIHIIAELVGGAGAASEIVHAAIRHGKSVVTANKELMAAQGTEIWDEAIRAGICLAMEASVAGGIPIHAVLREGISGDRVEALIGILNGTSNYILTEMEARGEPLETILAEAQRLGYAKADPGADIDGYDARSKLSILAALAYGVRVLASDIYLEGIRRISPLDFAYAHQLGHTIRLVGAARQTPEGLLLSVRPALIPRSTILAHVAGAYNAIWVKGVHGADTFYYGRGAGPFPTGVAVVSDLMRVAREIVNGSPERVSPFAHDRLREYAPITIDRQVRPYYLRFRVADRPGIIAALASILASAHISLEAVLQQPCANKQDLPFVITLEPTPERAVREAVEKMAGLDFLLEPPLALPMELPLA